MMKAFRGIKLKQTHAEKNHDSPNEAGERTHHEILSNKKLHTSVKTNILRS